MKSIKTICTLFLTIVFLNTANTQVTQEWAARYNGPGNSHDFGYSIAVDDAGNVYTTGYTGVGPYFDYATVKYNSSGAQQWEAIYNGTAGGTDYSYAIAVDGAGNSYVTGGSVGFETGYYDCVTIKYNSSGVQQWAARYDLGGGDFGRAIAVDASGNVYVTGESGGLGTGNDYITIKYNSSGVQQWLTRYNGPFNSDDGATSIALDGFGNVFVTGESNSSSFFHEYATVKYNSSGVQQWASRYNGPGAGNDNASSIALSPAGNVCVTGRSTGIESNTDYATVQYSPEGIQMWASRYNGPGNAGDVATDVEVDNSGNVYVTGYSSRLVDNFDYATIKYNSDGDTLWVSRYNGPGNYRDYANSLALDGFGNVYVTGYSRGLESNDYVTIKYNLSGAQQWLATYNAPGNSSEEARSIAVDGLGNVYVTGYSSATATGWDYATIKYSQTVGINTNSSAVPDKYSLSQNYPNPFNPKTIINFQLTAFSNVSIKVYDILGNDVEELVNENISAGSYSVEWDASGYSSGTYFYKITAGNFTDVKRMVLTK